MGPQRRTLRWCGRVVAAMGVDEWSITTVIQWVSHPSPPLIRHPLPLSALPTLAAPEEVSVSVAALWEAMILLALRPPPAAVVEATSVPPVGIGIQLHPVRYAESMLTFIFTYCLFANGSKFCLLLKKRFLRVLALLHPCDALSKLYASLVQYYLLEVCLFMLLKGYSWKSGLVWTIVPNHCNHSKDKALCSR